MSAVAGPAPVIVADGLTKRYGERVAVDRLHLQIRRGEVFGLLGPNGAGKTTTVLMLLGLSEPTEGTATVLGHDPTRDPLAIKRRVGYLPDSVGFYGHLTGRENLRYTTRLNGIPRAVAEARIDEVLDQVGLGDAGRRRTAEYSRGMIQRLGIADALVKDPEVLILDEPTIAIDPRGVEELLGLIDGLRRDHSVTVLLSSHLLHQVQAICDRVGIFVSGRLVATGTVDDLARELTGGRQTVEIGVDATVGDGLDGAERILRERAGDTEVTRDGDALLLSTTGDPRAELNAALVGAGLAVTRLGIRSSSLDDIYTRYFTAYEEVASGDGDDAREDEEVTAS